MANASAASTEYWTTGRFYRKVAELQEKRSFVSAWFEDFRDSLVKIFGLDPAKAWENLMFEACIYQMLETVEKMEKEHLLPTISKYAYDEAKREWEGPDTQAKIQREMTFAENTNKNLWKIIKDDFPAALDGLPLENEGARAHCWNELAKLLRMRRLAK
jgi:hypothetical protein